MVDKEDLLKQAEEIHSGLKRLSLKNRKGCNASSQRV